MSKYLSRGPAPESEFVLTVGQMNPVVGFIHDARDYLTRKDDTPEAQRLLAEAERLIEQIKTYYRP